MACKHCGKKFHACISCGLIGYEWEYCSDKCWDISEEKKLYDEFLNSLTERQVELLRDFIEDSELELEFALNRFIASNRI